MNLKNIIGLNLRDALEAIEDKSLPIKVGAKYGNNYFYCGTVGDLEKNLEKLSEEKHKEFVAARERTKGELEASVRNFPKIRSRVLIGNIPLTKWIESVKACALEYDEYRTKATLDFLMDCGKWAEKVRDGRNALNNSEKRLEGFMPLGSRGVMDAFFSSPVADDACPLVLIISGYEAGKYWTVDEAKK